MTQPTHDDAEYRAMLRALTRRLAAETYAEVKRCLPCFCVRNDHNHDVDCPAFYRASILGLMTDHIISSQRSFNKYELN